MRSQYRDVDRLADICGKPFAYLTALLGDIESPRHRVCQPQDPESEPILARS